MKEKPKKIKVVNPKKVARNEWAALSTIVKKQWNLNNSARKECLKNAQVSFTFPHKWKCTACLESFSESDRATDHIIPVGEIPKTKKDFVAWCVRLFVEVEELQVLCHPCHQIKTNKDAHDKRYIEYYNMIVEHCTEGEPTFPVWITSALNSYPLVKECATIIKLQEKNKNKPKLFEKYSQKIDEFKSKYF